MPKPSINEELTNAEAALTSLAEAIQRKVNSEERREEYYTLLQQANLALNKIRASSEMRDWFNNGGPEAALDKLS